MHYIGFLAEQLDQTAKVITSRVLAVGQSYLLRESEVLCCVCSLSVIFSVQCSVSGVNRALLLISFDRIARPVEGPGRFGSSLHSSLEQNNPSL